MKIERPAMPSAFVVYCFVIILHLVPLWSYENFATQDGPSHLHNSAVMLDLSTVESPLFKQYYEMKFTFAGNLLSQLALMSLLSVFSPSLADKIFLSLYVVLFCLGFWYAVSSVRRESKWIAFLIFPFVYSSWLHLGFYNFLLGMAAFFFVTGYFIRHQENVGVKPAGVLAFSFVVLFFTHLTAFCSALIMVVGLTMASVLVQTRNQRSVKAKTLLWLLIAVVPGALLLRLFLGNHILYTLPVDLHFSLWTIHSIAPLASSSELEYRFGDLMAALVGGLAIAALYFMWKHGKVRRLDGTLAAAAGFFLLVIVGPEAASTGGLIRLRMVLYFYLALILWISAQSIPKAIAKSAALVAVGISVLFFVSRAPVYAELNRQIEEYLSAGSYIESNTTILGLSYASHGYDPNPQRWPAYVYLPFEHISGLLAADKPVVDLSNYESALSTFWTRYRPEVNPFRFVDKVTKSDSRASAANLYGYPPDSGGRIDYVLLWGLDENRQRVNPPSPLRDQLRDAYDLIYVSPDRHLVQLYRRKDFERAVAVRKENPERQSNGQATQPISWK